MYLTETSRSGIEHEKTIYPNNAHIEIAADGTRHVVFNDGTRFVIFLILLYSDQIYDFHFSQTLEPFLPFIS